MGKTDVYPSKGCLPLQSIHGTELRSNMKHVVKIRYQETENKVKMGLVNSERVYEVYKIESLGSGLHPGKILKPPPEKLDIFFCHALNQLAPC